MSGLRKLRQAISIFDKVKESEKFKDYFTKWKEEWYFAKPEDTEQTLKDLGFRNIEVYLSKAPIGFDNKGNCSLYIKTVVLGPYFKYIKVDKDKEDYLESILND